MAFCAYCGSPVAEVSYRPCPSCGNPANGAPRAQLGTGGTNAAIIAVVAMILAFLAIPAMGIIAAIAIPNLLTSIQRSKQKRTMADMRSISQEIERHRISKGTYPETLAVLDVPTTNDGWGHPMRYECIPDAERRCAGYGIVSAGKDKEFEHDSLADYSEDSTVPFDRDIVFANGSFVQYPQGVRR